MGGQQIEQLDGFGQLTNLQRLWLNDNRLRAVMGLEANIRLKELYVQVGGGQASSPCAPAGALRVACASASS